MIDSLLDLLDNYPNPLPEGSIPYFDWCDWITVVLPQWWINTCNDVQDCITESFIMSLINVDSSLSVSWWSLSVSDTWINENITVNWTSPNLTVGNTTLDLSTLLDEFSLTFNDWSNSFSVSHSDTIMLEWLDWLRFLATSPNRLQIWLPTWAWDKQVLTWNADTWEAYWNNDQCCAQTLSFDTATNILSISWTNAVDLTSINTDNQELGLSGNILSITQLGSWPQAIDLTNVNEHTIQLTWNVLSILWSDWVVNATVDLLNVWPSTIDFNDTTNEIQIKNDNWDIISHVNISWVNNQTLSVQAWTDPCADGWAQIWISQPDGSTQRIDIPATPIQCCDDVMDCSWIQAMISDIAALYNLAAQLQTQIDNLNTQIA